VSGRLIASVLVGLTVIGLTAAIFFFAHGRGGSSSSAPVPQPVPQPQPSPQPQPNPAPPSGDWPRNQIADRVGVFTLQSVKRNPTLISGSATDAYIAVYKSAAGIQISFSILAMKSKSAARRDAQGFASYLLQKKGFTRTEPDFKVTEQGTGNVLGIGAHLLKGSEEAVVWSNGRLSLLSDGPKPSSIKFYNASRV
jgi:hypothetical protein